MGAKSLIPKSKTKTAYGLLSEVKSLILAEPLRYDQTCFTTDATMRARRPACGTVCCVAGWVATLKSPSPIRDPFEVSDFARDVLGLDNSQRSELVDIYAAGMTQPVAAHAKRGAAHIAKFQRKYAAQLKAKRV